MNIPRPWFHHPQYYFWRTYDGQEIDLVESYNGRLKAFECKWKSSHARKPVAFAKAYPEALFTLVNQENYLKIITGQWAEK